MPNDPFKRKGVVDLTGTEDQPTPSKRQRTDADCQKAPPETVIDMPSKITVSLSNLCSTPGCQSTIPAESTSMRCMRCVRLDWNKFHPISTPAHERKSTLAMQIGAKPKKSVTWSDTVASVPSTMNGNTCCIEQVPLPESNAERYCANEDEESSDLTEIDENVSADDTPQISPIMKTGIMIKIPTLSRAIEARTCKTAHCSRTLSVKFVGKICVMCKTYSRRRQNILENEYGALPLDEYPPKLIPKARLCAEKECTHFIPPRDEYNFKWCSLCRIHQEDWHRDKCQSGESGSRVSEDVKRIFSVLECLPVRMPTPGSCRNLDCGVSYEKESRLCRQCSYRRAKLMKKMKDQRKDITVANSEDNALPNLIFFPQYRSHAFLLSDFIGRLQTFLLRPQAFFFTNTDEQLRTHDSGTKTVFTFDGEYSVVTLDFDVVGRKAEIEAQVLETKDVLRSVEGLNFAPKRLMSAMLEGGGLAFRFLCTYQNSYLQPQVFEDETMMRTMEGELDVAVFPDRSHLHKLPGEKTIIRFRLFG